MKQYSRSHLSDPALLHSLAQRASTEREATAELLADMAEVDSRQLFLPAGYPSMFEYCVKVLRFSGDEAYLRIKAARAARRFPAIFEALADGRLHLTAVVLLRPHLTEDTAAELLKAAIHKTKAEIEQLLAERYPKSDVLAWVASVPPPPRPAGEQVLEPVETGPHQHPRPVAERPLPAPAPALQAPAARAIPLTAQSFAVQFTLSKADHDLLRHAQDLLGFQGANVGEVFARALRELVPRLEKAKCAATIRPSRRPRRDSANPRHIPANVRRAVWQRDGGRCTFVSDSGRRCDARRGLQFDHVLEVARGGEATVDGIRLRCRGHNQFEAERTFGAEFMRHKRIAAAETRAVEKARRALEAVRASGPAATAAG